MGRASSHVPSNVGEVVVELMSAGSPCQPAGEVQDAFAVVWTQAEKQVSQLEEKFVAPGWRQGSRVASRLSWASSCG